MSDEDHEAAAASWTPPSSTEQRIERIENAVADLHRARRIEAPRVTVTCRHCGTSEEREVPRNAHDFPVILQAFRDEVRACALLDVPTQWHAPPPHDLRVEESVLAAALSGLRSAHMQKLRRSHFFLPLHGLLWEAILARPALGHAPAGMSVDDRAQHSLAQAEALRDQIVFDLDQRELARPWHTKPRLERLLFDVPASTAPADIDRLLQLAWQREVLTTTQDLVAMLHQDHPHGRGVSTRGSTIVEDVKAQLLVLREHVLRGPE